MYTFFTDNGPDYSCPKCGRNTIGEIGHECKENVEEEIEIYVKMPPKSTRKVNIIKMEV